MSDLAYPGDFVGTGQRLGDGDLRAAAALLGVSVAKVCAVRDVESRGRGFHPDTKRPVILFEPHVFHKLTAGRFDGVAPDISYPVWGTHPYPPSQTERYDQLRRAMQLDASAALRSASWGLFQLMGYNFDVCGFASVGAFVAAMCAGEGEQLVAFARLVASKPTMLSALRMGDWAGFARLYNGPGYAQHGYDQRLKAAFATYRAPAAAAPSTVEA